jgi:hypothetical protein
MSKALAIVTLCSAIVVLGAVEAGAARLGPICLSLVPTPPSLFFPSLTLQVFLDSEPYGQVFLGTARTLNVQDTPSFVSLQAVGKLIRVSIVGPSNQINSGGVTTGRPAFAAGGQLDTQVNPPSGDAAITITDPGVGVIDNGQVVPIGTIPGKVAVVSCP